MMNAPMGQEHVVKKSKFTEEQIAFALKQAKLGTEVEEVCRKLGISEATFYVRERLDVDIDLPLCLQAQGRERPEVAHRYLDGLLWTRLQR